MFAFLRRCVPGASHASIHDGCVRGYPCSPLLMHRVVNVEPQAVFAAVVNFDAQQRMREEVEKLVQEQALRGAPVCQVMDQIAEHECDAEHECVDPIDYATGGVIYGSDCKTSYFVEALKCYKDGGACVI